MAHADRHLEAVDPEDRARVQEAVERQSKGEPTQLEFRIRRVDGAVRWLEDRAFPLTSDQGVVIEVHGVTRDITEARASLSERQAMERRLLASQKLEKPGGSRRRDRA